MSFTKVHNRCHESIPSQMDCFDEFRPTCRIAKNLTQLAYCCLKACIEVHVRIFWPQLATEFVATGCLPGAFKQENKKLERLILEFDLRAALPRSEERRRGPESFTR